MCKGKRRDDVTIHAAVPSWSWQKHEVKQRNGEQGRGDVEWKTTGRYKKCRLGDTRSADWEIQEVQKEAMGSHEKKEEDKKWAQQQKQVDKGCKAT